MNDSELKTPLIKENNYAVERIEHTKIHFYEESSDSISGSVFCLLCLTFGTGILALPYSLSRIGVVLGLAIYLLASYSVYITLGLLTKTAYKHNILSYSKLISFHYGQKGVMMYELMNLLSNIGSIIVYQQISKYIFIQFSTSPQLLSNISAILTHY
jgi:amino acid permease